MDPSLPDTVTDAAATSTEAITALRKIISFLEQHSTLLFVLLPFAGGWGLGGNSAWAGPFSPELWYQSLFLLGLITVGLIIPARIFSGPVRLAYLEGNVLVASFTRHLPHWSSGNWPSRGFLLFLAFVPAARVWALAIMLAAWQYLLYKYRQGVYDIAKDVDKSCYLATVAVESAYRYAERATKNETRAMEVAATARRDLKIMRSLRITDYFDVAAESWSALGRITAPLESATRTAKRMLEEVERCPDNGLEEDQDEAGEELSLVTILYDTAKSAVKATEEMEEYARAAQARVGDSQTAQEQAEATRLAEAESHRAVNAAVEQFKISIESVPLDLSKVKERAEKVKWLAALAKASAEGGDFGIARSLAVEAGEEAAEAVRWEQKLFSDVKGACEVLWRLHLGK